MIDMELLREQRNFLLEYAWREGYVPELVEGLINFIEYEMDKGEGYGMGLRNNPHQHIQR